MNFKGKRGSKWCQTFRSLVSPHKETQKGMLESSNSKIQHQRTRGGADRPLGSATTLWAQLGLSFFVWASKVMGQVIRGCMGFISMEKMCRIEIY